MKTDLDKITKGSQIVFGKGKGDVNCIYIRRASGKTYPRTCEKCRLGPCPFNELYIKTYEDSLAESNEIFNDIIDKWKEENSDYLFSETSLYWAKAMLQWMLDSDMIKDA